ncbi:hypothetical protein C2845_PM07G38920 [Panicum miliaceum]|uniref:Uncharacterized protein n=1 Tax=Panicum miliaceum TaxID=4540 RepID=A0A3L6SJA2_PANMI|nr:hypothetical protein C2845_PM07G38920 [Panicum miliaceum]
MTDADIEALVAQGLLPEKAISGWWSCFGGKYPEASFKDSNKRWAKEWFVVANPAPGLPPRTGRLPVLNAKWEKKSTDEEMVEVEVLLVELQKLKTEKLTGATVALSFAKRLTQSIQERVHPGYEYSGCNGPIRVQNYKVSRSEALRRVTVIVSGEVRNKDCLKAYCLKRPTTEEKIVSFSCPMPLPEGQQGKAVSPPAGLALLAAYVGSFSSDSSIGSESDDVVEVSGPAAGAGSTTKKRRPTRKLAAPKAQRGGVAPLGRSSTPLGASRVEAQAAAEKAGLTTPKPEEEDQGEEQGRPANSPARVARASVSGPKRKAEESTSEVVSAEVAKGKRPLARPRLIEGAATQAEEVVAALEPPQGDDIAPLGVTPGDGAMAGVVEDPADPNAGPRVIAPVLAAAQEPSEEKAPGEEVVVTKEALIEVA